MKQYIVRLRGYNGFVVDGEYYEAPNKKMAKEMYLERCKRLGIAVGKYDYITVEEDKA